MNRARRLIHRDSAPILSFSGFGAKKNEERRKSEVALPPTPVVQPHLPKFYIKGINREKAEEILNHQPVGTFLVRDRETATNSGSYTLSLRHKVGLKHHKIETIPEANKIVIAGYERFQFDTFEQLTEFFVRSQKKEITLVPYDPDAESLKRTSVNEQPAYEEMDPPEGIHETEQMYLKMDDGYLQPNDPGYPSYQNGSNSPPPPLPNRGRSRQGPTQSYQNLAPPKRAVPTVHAQTGRNSYENMPEKVPAPISPIDPTAPPIPSRVPPSSGQSYQNMPGKSNTGLQHVSYENTSPRSANSIPPRNSPKPCRDSYQNVPDRLSQGPPDRGSYQNVPGRSSPGPPIPERHTKHGPGYENYTSSPTGYENYFSKNERQSTSPQQGAGSHSYQNLPPKVTPRRAATQVVNYSAEQALPRRQPVPIRRVKTDTERDFSARRQ